MATVEGIKQAIFYLHAKRVKVKEVLKKERDSYQPSKRVIAELHAEIIAINLELESRNAARYAMIHHPPLR